MNAIQHYNMILNVLAATLQQYGGQLGLMVPGNPIQLAVPNGIKVYGNLYAYNRFGIQKALVASRYPYSSPPFSLFDFL